MTREPSASPQRYFREAYNDVMYSGAVGVYSRFVHWLLERPYRHARTPVVLELGAGHGQHAPFVRGQVETYLETDLDATLAPAGERLVCGRPVQRRQLDATDLSEFADGSVDRVIATCLLAHLDRPEEALQEWRRVVRPGGYLTIYVPAEPGMLLRMLRHLVMVPKSRKHGQDHLATVYRDHRNHYPLMRTVLRSVFAGDEVKRVRFPLRWLGWNFSLFEVYHVTRSR